GTGLAALGNGAEGVKIVGAHGNLVGGTAFASRYNVIAGNVAHGISLSGAAGNLVLGNNIGLARDDSALGNGGAGGTIHDGARMNEIGDNRRGNFIGYNRGNGVEVLGATSTGNRIRANGIFANRGLGIDLGGDGVTLNDPRDPDTGPNQLQNYPVLTE